MRATPFLVEMNFSMIANVNDTAEQRKLTKFALPIGWLCFTPPAVQTDNLTSKLPTQTHQTAQSRFKNVIF